MRERSASLNIIFFLPSSLTCPLVLFPPNEAASLFSFPPFSLYFFRMKKKRDKIGGGGGGGVGAAPTPPYPPQNGGGEGEAKLFVFLLLFMPNPPPFLLLLFLPAFLSPHLTTYGVRCGERKAGQKSRRKGGGND